MSLLGTIGQVAGGVVGGPVGAAVGGAIGGAIGGGGGGGGPGGAEAAEFSQALFKIATQPFQDAMNDMQEAWGEDDEE